MKKDMKKDMKKAVGLWMLAAVIFSSVSQASPANTFSPVALTPMEGCTIIKVDGEHIPFPLREANTKFALADGQTYLLNGTLVLLSGKVFLNVDLVSQPWLATPKVVANPYFEVSSIDAVSVQQLSGQIVQVAVIANRVPSTSGTDTSVMKLDSILPPATNNP